MCVCVYTHVHTRQVKSRDQDRVVENLVKPQEDRCFEAGRKINSGVQHGNDGSNGFLVSLFKVVQVHRPEDTVNPLYTS